MKAPLHLPFLLSLAAVAPLAAQDIGLQVGSLTGVSGTPCDPWSCTPAPVQASAGTTASLRLKGARWQPHFLLLSAAPAQCVQIPGIARSLILQAPGNAFLVTLNWSHVYVMGPPPTCGGWIGTGTLPLPATLPTGSSFLLQALAPVQVVSGDQWTFSNAVRITIL